MACDVTPRLFAMTLLPGYLACGEGKKAADRSLEPGVGPREAGSWIGGIFARKLSHFFLQLPEDGEISEVGVTLWHG